MFTPVFAAVSPALFTHKTQLGEQLCAPYLSRFEVIGSQASGQKQARKLFLGLGFK